MVEPSGASVSAARREHVPFTVRQTPSGAAFRKVVEGVHLDLDRPIGLAAPFGASIGAALRRAANDREVEEMTTKLVEIGERRVAVRIWVQECKLRSAGNVAFMAGIGGYRVGLALSNWQLEFPAAGGAGEAERGTPGSYSAPIVVKPGIDERSDPDDMPNLWWAIFAAARDDPFGGARVRVLVAAVASSALCDETRRTPTVMPSLRRVIGANACAREVQEISYHNVSGLDWPAARLVTDDSTAGRGVRVPISNSP